MWHYRFTSLMTGCLLTLAIATGAVPASAQAGPTSDLSRWLSNEVMADIRQMLSRHPRYAGQRVQVEAGHRDGLSEAIAILLNNNLAGREGINLIAPGQAALPDLAAPGSIDQLDCGDSPRFDYLLRATASSAAKGQDQVQLELVDIAAADEQAHSWYWRGTLSSAERRQLQLAPANSLADGSLGAPWNDQDVKAAALSLTRDFVCAVRPQVRDRLSLNWSAHTDLPALFADTANTARHLLGDYRELVIGPDQSGYKIEVRIERFRDDTWQLWLTGTPASPDLAPVQAVTYFRAGDPGGSHAATAAASAPPPGRKASTRPGPALEFIDVQMLDAIQADRGRSRADLLVTLRIDNRANWPIAYSFTLSGGHFDHCLAQPGYYRHDRYGLLQGSLEAGSTVVRRLVIEGAKHRPAPLYGVPKCAGFRDLQGFEEFASHGHKVTDYVRWDM